MNPPALFFFFKIVWAILGPLMLNRLLEDQLSVVSAIRTHLLAEAPETGLHMSRTTTRSGLLCVLPSRSAASAVLPRLQGWVS